MHELSRDYQSPDIYQGQGAVLIVTSEIEAWQPLADEGSSYEEAMEIELSVMQFIIQSAEAEHEPLEPTAIAQGDEVSSQTTPRVTAQVESTKPTEEFPTVETAGPPKLPPPPRKPPTGAAELPPPSDGPNEPSDEGLSVVGAKGLELTKEETAAEEPLVVPPFDMDPKEAKTLGLTVTEWMRHRWTGEFPDRVEELNRQTFRDQTASRFQPIVPISEVPEPASQQESTPAAEIDVPTFSSHYEFKQWAVPELGVLTEEIVDLVNKPDVDAYLDITGRAERLLQAENTVPQYYDHTLRTVKDAYFATTDLVLDSAVMPTAMKTGLIDAMGVPYLDQRNKEILVKQLGRDLTTDTGIELCAELLGRQTISAEAAVEALRSVVDQKKSPTNVVTIAASVLEPLTQRVQHIIETKDYYTARPEVRLLSTILNKLDSKENAQQAEALGLDFQELADTVSAIFNTQLDEINQHEVFITHPTTAYIMNALYSLYCSRDRPRPEPSDSLKLFLDVIYRVKLERYTSHPEVIAMRDKFNELAEVCGQSLRVKRRSGYL